MNVSTGERFFTAVHEAAHAVVALLTAVPLRSVSVDGFVHLDLTRQIRDAIAAKDPGALDMLIDGRLFAVLFAGPIVRE